MKLLPFFAFLLTFFANAQVELEKIQVINDQETFSDFWEENKSTEIFSGKKNTVTSLKEIPQLQTNNYRQATSQTPGLLISEIPNESLAAITYRGLGDPHESYNLLLLQDGIPVAADMYGYPAHYYSPALPIMEKVQFTRGGASLLYGPQPGGVLNYHSRALQKNQNFSGKAGLTYGSYNLLSTNNAVYGSKENKSYGLEYHRRQGDGPQSVNSDFYADYLQARQQIYEGRNTWKLSFNGYNSDHGNTGGFAKTKSANVVTFGDDISKAARKHDRLKVSRAQLHGGVEHKIDDQSQLQVNLWANAYRRYSKYQNSTGDVFGQIANGNTNKIVTQDYFGYNGEIRYLKNYGENTFSAGLLNYNLQSPYVEETGAKADANHGSVTRRIGRGTFVNSLFIENRFALGKLMITPGMRVENIRQTINERQRNGSTNLRKNDETVTVPLLGLGMSFHLSDQSQLYANISEAYKPVTYQEAVPINNTATISEDIDPSRIISYEFGYRAQTEKLVIDTSAFFIRFENKFGKIGENYGNTGAGTNKGVDLAAEYKLTPEYSLYGNTEVLDARYTRGNLKDKTPQYAPKNITRTGLIHKKQDHYKIALMGVYVSRHFGDDTNSEKFEIPSYMVWDLTGDINLSKNWLVSGGINNILDKQYYSRVRNEGVAWALGRNYYVGATYKF